MQPKATAVWVRLRDSLQFLVLEKGRESRQRATIPSTEQTPKARVARSSFDVGAIDCTEVRTAGVTPRIRAITIAEVPNSGD